MKVWISAREGRRPDRLQSWSDDVAGLSLATQAGVLLARRCIPPEQAKGKTVDKRADLWSFGCLLFEMLAARRPFEGETTSDVLAKIIEREPDWNALPAYTPPSIRTLLRRCLEKDPRRRLDSAAVARLEIEEAITAPTPGDLASNEVRRGAARPSRLVVAVAVLVAAVAAAVAWAVTRPAQTPPGPVSRFAITLPPTLPLAFSINDRDVALSADGTRLAYAAGDQAQLMVRALDQLDAVPLAGIANARAPFHSPDGRWIGFFERLDEGVATGPVTQRTALRKVSMSGGTPLVVCTMTGASRGASWGPDDSIIFATSDPATGLLRVPAGGGEPEVLTKPDTTRGERDHYFPSVLPGARGVLFTITTGRGPGNGEVAVLDLKTGRHKTLVRSGMQAEYIDTGHLIYADRGTLWAVPFDLATLNVVGDAAPIVAQVLTLGAADFTLSRHGTLVYVPTGGGKARSLAWVTRNSIAEPISAPPNRYVLPRLSPDGLASRSKSVPATNRLGYLDGTRPRAVDAADFRPGRPLRAGVDTWGAAGDLRVAVRKRARAPSAGGRRHRPGRRVDQESVSTAGQCGVTRRRAPGIRGRDADGRF